MLVGQLAGLGIADDKAFHVVADRGTDHLARDRQKFLLERSHCHHRPFDQSRHFIEQRLVLDQLKALRECELPGIGLNNVLAALRLQHDLRRLKFCLIILEAAHLDRRRRHEAVAKGGLARLDAVDGQFHHIRLFVFHAESGDD